MTINAAAMTLIKTSEGWRAQAYADPGTGGEPWTIGYGHTTAAGQPAVVKGMTITLSQGEIILANDLAPVELAVTNLVKVPLTENEYGALVSFVFNVGVANFTNSTLLKELNTGNYRGAADQLLLWTHANGKVLPGLVTRRNAERALFLTADGQETIPLPTQLKSVQPAPTAPPVPSTPVLNPLEQLQMNLSMLTLIFHYLPLLPFLQQDLSFEVKTVNSSADGTTKLNQTLVVLKDLIAQIEAATAGTAIPPSPTS